MTTVKVTAIEPFNNHRPGDVVEVTEREAKQLVDKRLAKMAVEPSNKMAPDAERGNKANPSPAAGEASRSSASPAVPASAKTTAKKSAGGAAAKKAAGSSR